MLLVQADVLQSYDKNVEKPKPNIPIISRGGDSFMSEVRDLRSEPWSLDNLTMDSIQRHHSIEVVYYAEPMVIDLYRLPCIAGYLSKM